MAFDALGLAISFTTMYGIFAILSISLNLEYGFAGQPNFGQVFFYGLGAFVAAILAANLLPYFSRHAVGSICAINAIILRGNIATNEPTIALSSWILALILAMACGGIAGFVLSYPAIRVKEEWFLAMILLVTGDMFIIFVDNTPQFGCGLNGVPGLLTPFTWLANDISKQYPTITRTYPNYISTGLYALVVLGFALACFFIAQRLARSPYGRLLKAMRDDYIAAESLGKDVNKLRGRIMVIGSAMAGLAGGLYVFYIGVATTEDYVSAVTFTLWVMLILGGYANNRGVLLGTFILTALQQGSTFLGTYIQLYIGGFNSDLIIYGEYIFEAIILLLLLVYRPKGLIPEKPVRTNAYELFKFGKKEGEEGKADDTRDHS